MICLGHGSLLCHFAEVFSKRILRNDDKNDYTLVMAEETICLCVFEEIRREGKHSSFKKSVDQSQ